MTKVELKDLMTRQKDTISLIIFSVMLVGGILFGIFIPTFGFDCDKLDAEDKVIQSCKDTGRNLSLTTVCMFFFVGVIITVFQIKMNHRDEKLFKKQNGLCSRCFKEFDIEGFWVKTPNELFHDFCMTDEERKEVKNE